MIDPFSIAVEGLVPGNIKHFNVAILGFNFDIELIVRPLDTGGGVSRDFGIPDLKKYEVTVKIIYKDKVWSDTREMNSFGLATLEKVIASFKAIHNLASKTVIFASYLKSKLLNMPIINIRKK